MVDIVRPPKKVETQKKIEPKKEVVEEEINQIFYSEEKKIGTLKYIKPIIPKKEVLPRKPRERRPFKKIPFKLVLAIVVVCVLVYLAFWILPKADINIVTKKASLDINEQIVATKNISGVSIGPKQVPAEVFSQKKNDVFSFPATGKKNVERKASGSITIFNTFSSDNQPLVANTRLLAPDGKVFRLEKSIVVPGAKIVGGKIVSSSIQTTVIADKPGQQYNIGPTANFTIPGFQGSEKYQSFYGKSDVSMSGGFIGEVKVPTEEDIKKAKESSEKSLKEYLDSFFAVQIPHDFKIIDGASQFKVLKEEAGKEADDQGNFPLVIEAEASAIGFRESDVIAIFSDMAKGKLADGFTLNTYEISYANANADFVKGILNFSADFNGMFNPPIDINAFKRQIVGKNELDLKTFIFAQPDIEKATISFWPFWVKKAPNNINKVNITVK